MAPKEALEAFKRRRPREQKHQSAKTTTKEGNWQILTTTLHRLEYILRGGNTE